MSRPSQPPARVNTRGCHQDIVLRIDTTNRQSLANQSYKVCRRSGERRKPTPLRGLIVHSYLPELHGLTVPETPTTDVVLLQVLRETFHVPNIPTPLHEVVL